MIENLIDNYKFIKIKNFINIIKSFSFFLFNRYVGIANNSIWNKSILHNVFFYLINIMFKFFLLKKYEMQIKKGIIKTIEREKNRYGKFF